MDQELAPARPTTFNGPLEAGVRALTILAAAYPRSFDLQRLIAFDYFLVHSGDIPDAPTSLHPPAPLQAAQVLVRRRLVEQGLLLMMTRHLVERTPSSSGMRYQAGENAAPYLSRLESPYTRALCSRAVWLTRKLGSLPDEQFKGFVRSKLDNWVEQFQSLDGTPSEL